MLWLIFIELTEIPMLTLLLYAGLFVIGVAVGAYSHKWFAKVTGAPSNLSVATAPAAVSTLVAHGEAAAVSAITSASVAAVAKIKA